jgi:hypothetical protein
MFDIASIEVSDTTDIAIMNPSTGEPLIGEDDKACTVTVYGPGSKPFKAAQSVASNRAMKRVRAKGRNAETTPDEEAAATASFLSAITVSFNNFNYGGSGEPEAIRRAYADPKMGWLTEQVNAGAGDWAAFTKAA